MENLDSFYKPLFEEFGLEFIKDAGWFEEKQTYTIDYKIPSTPFLFMKSKLKEAKKPCILLICGAFCPIHEGHIEMLTKSKEKLELNGWNVVGGYFAPSHQDYVENKNMVKH